MKHQLKFLALAVLLCSCSSTSVEKTWKSPTYVGGPVKKVAVVAISDQGFVRTALENRLARTIGARGQAAIPTAELLTLAQIKEDKAAATARLRQAGADSILIMRLVDQATYDRQVLASPALFGTASMGYGASDWYDYYSFGFTGMGVSYNSMRDYLVLDSSLFELATGVRLWSVVTQTVLKEDADRLVVADKLAEKVAAQLLNDKMIR